MNIALRIALFLASIVSVILILVGVFTRVNKDIDKADVLEMLALAFGLVAAFFDLRKVDRSPS